MLSFAAWIVAGFVGVELASYVVHRWLFHGPLWFIHQTHHLRRRGTFEWNDLFSMGAGVASLPLFWMGRADPLNSVALPIGIGIALFGVLYFILHDLYTHRRFAPFKTDNRFAQTIRRAHQRHHQSAEKDGLEPYGLFFVPYWRFVPPAAAVPSGDGAATESSRPG